MTKTLENISYMIDISGSEKKVNLEKISKETFSGQFIIRGRGHCQKSGDYFTF